MVWAGDTGQVGDSVVVLDAPGNATAADGNATAIWVSGGSVPCSGGESPCYDYTVQAAGYDPDGMPVVELISPTAGIVGEPVDISTPTENVYSPLIDFGDGESVAHTQASHVYKEPGEYEVTFGGAEVLGYRSSVVRTITILPTGTGPEPEVEPPGGVPTEPEDESFGRETSDPKGTPVAPPHGDTPSNDTLPPTQCAVARTAYRSALRRFRLTHAKLGRAHDSAGIRRLAKAERKQAAALDRARRHVADAC